MLENPAPPLLNFYLPMTYSSKERSPYIAPPPSTPTPNQNNPPEKVCPLHNNHYCM